MYHGCGNLNEILKIEAYSQYYNWILKSAATLHYWKRGNSWLKPDVFSQLKLCIDLKKHQKWVKLRQPLDYLFMIQRLTDVFLDF